MRLEIESIDVKDIQAGSKTYAKEGVLYINLKELEELILRDPRIKSVEINLVVPRRQGPGIKHIRCDSTSL